MRPRMVPARDSSRRLQSVNPAQDESTQSDLFLEPMMDNPLAIYVNKDARDRDTVANLIIIRLRSAVKILSAYIPAPS